ncbi:glycosyl hydrolase [Flavitalea sp. BT771]|uniref:glycosyl hydrolase n=1 Tax=Flavitalea sp. BT771 TaxID=3063329 RepID=UPI0026E431A1|nr:glycosyl hydrolase [Flavitalea sp. BT771]MDO6429371.1 glycosyl hydrolase [Flavitalea sp. BT771]MDV6218501.1 glycosyl hydrolase [Flavitalea sp. BT771]
MKRPLLCIAGWLACLPLTAQKLAYSLHTSDTIPYAAVQKGFLNPPAEARLRCYWWWLNSMATKASITRDLEQMKAKGYGGASIVDAGSSNYEVAHKTKAGPVFMSPAWMELYRHAVKEAQRLGIELSVNVQSGWNPGGPTITPELALKAITYSELTVQGGRKIQVTLPQPPFKLLYTDIVVQAFKQPAGMPLKDSAIKNWGIKSFNQSFGFRGTYPLYKLREEYPGAESKEGIRKDGIIDLTAQCKDGVLTWEAPEGTWTVIRYGWTCTGASTSTSSDGWSGLSLDHLNPQAFKKFSDDVIIPLINNARAAGNSVHFLQTDSWEMGNVGWTNDFPAEFKRFRGYDLRPYLPVLTGRIVETVDQSDRFLHDYRQTVGDCIATYHYQLFSDLAHANGMGIHPESGGPHSAPVDALKVMAISDFPQGEFWATSNTHRIKDDERLAVKQSASVAHTNGKRFVGAEGPTTIGPQWERAPRELKANIDRVFCSGVNRIVWHTFTSSPKEFGLPGNEYFAGTHLNPNVTWWKQAGDFISYLNRCSYLLSQGLFVADVLYYYGDDVPSFVFIKEDVKDLAFGHDWDKCSKQALLNRVSVKDSQLQFPDGMRYRLLVLPDENAIDLAVLRKLETLVKDGLTIVAPRPAKATSLTGFPAADKEINAIAARMWGNIDGVTITENKYGKGSVIFGKDVNTVLKEQNALPDFSFTSTRENTALDYIHRTGEGMDIYFVANRFGKRAINDFEFRYDPSLPDRYEQVECAFRVKGMTPELWDPMTGQMEEIVTWREENGRIFIPLYLEPEGSRFIVFRKKTPSPHVIKLVKDGRSLFPGNEYKDTDRPMIEIFKTGASTSSVTSAPGNYTLTWSDGKTSTVTCTQPNTVLPMTGTWQISFDTAWGGPAQIQTDTLQSWTAFKDSGIKFYSGTAIYRKRFTLSGDYDKEKKAVLDLGNVLEMASVSVNGHKMAVRWCAPFQFDITPYVHAGDNQLEVEVVNLWPNRLIGDGRLPQEQRRTQTNIKKFEQPGSEKYLRESGLLGPVTLRFYPRENISY